MRIDREEREEGKRWKSEKKEGMCLKNMRRKQKGEEGKEKKKLQLNMRLILVHMWKGSILYQLEEWVSRLQRRMIQMKGKFSIEEKISGGRLG